MEGHTQLLLGVYIPAFVEVSRMSLVLVEVSRMPLVLVEVSRRSLILVGVGIISTSTSASMLDCVLRGELMII